MVLRRLYNLKISPDDKDAGLQTRWSLKVDPTGKPWSRAAFKVVLVVLTRRSRSQVKLKTKTMVLERLYRLRSSPA